jgi:hypothetical protein
MQLSRAHRSGRSTGALLLPVEAVASAEPAQTLGRDDQQQRDVLSRWLLLAVQARRMQGSRVT